MKTLPETIFPPDALPSQKGDKMKIWHEDIAGVRWYFVDRAYIRGDGKPTHFRRKTSDPVKHAQQVIEAQNITGDCSLTSKRFAECIDTYLEERGAGGFNDACYNRAKKELGRLFPDKANFAGEYARYCARLEGSGLAINTVNNYKIVVRSVCNHAHKTKRCGPPAVTDYGIKQGVQRDRILSDGEWLSLQNKMIEWDSPIYQHVMFSMINPIRKRDLFSLPRTALKMELVGKQRIWVIKFVAQKTNTTRRKITITTLPNITPEFLRYVASLPPDCPWLFPIVGTGNKQNAKYTKLKAGQWRKVLDSDKHFNNLLDACDIHDFSWHDFKHCAETHMLRQGYTYEEMRKLGIQMSPKTQRLYDNRSQAEIVARMLSDSTFIASEKSRAS